MIDGDITKVVRWCSLFCEGNEATGDLRVPVGTEDTEIPICAECLEKVQADPAWAMHKILFGKD